MLLWGFLASQNPNSGLQMVTVFDLKMGGGNGAVFAPVALFLFAAVR